MLLALENTTWTSYYNLVNNVGNVNIFEHFLVILMTCSILPQGPNNKTSQQIWDEENTEGILLIDASNAFNALNRRVALHNILVVCPRPAMAIINTYRNPSRLFIVGGGELQSQEGTTQCDPLAMPFYAISVVVLMSLSRFG